MHSKHGSLLRKLQLSERCVSQNVFAALKHRQQMHFDLPLSFKI